jgi:type IV secretory pathway VirB10-like protein
VTKRLVPICLLTVFTAATLWALTAHAEGEGRRIAACEGAVLQNSQSHSKCVDGLWYVISDSEYLCADGTRKTETTKQKTEQTCTAAQEGQESHASGERQVAQEHEEIRKAPGSPGQGTQELEETGKGDKRKANECTKEQEPRNENKETWFRCVKGKNDTCGKSCELWQAKKSDDSDPEKIADQDEWKQGYPRKFKYYCKCK